MKPNWRKWGRDPAGRGRALALVELLMVAACAALLISILLPALRGVRQQSQLEHCLGNLRQIGGAMAMYFADNGEWFPFEKRNNLNGLHGFYYGGHPGRNINNDVWWGYIQPAFRDTPGGRPFNPYIYPGLPKWDVRPNDPLFEKVRGVPVFRCPADTGGAWNNEPGDVGQSPGGVPLPLYWSTGNSYDENYHFVMSWAMSFADPNNPNARKYWLQRSNAFVRVQLRRDAARFIVAYEDSFDSAQWNRIPRMGWHGQLNRHNFVFLDGHAANTLAVTSVAPWTSGLGWKSASGNSPSAPYAWWKDANDPDYRYRYIPLLP